MGHQLGMTKLVIDRQVYFIGQQQVIQRHVDVAQQSAWRKFVPAWRHLSPCWQRLARPSSWRRTSLGQWRQALLKSSKSRVKPNQTITRHAVGHLGVVGVRRQVAGLDHVHPGLAVRNQPILERGAAGISRTNQTEDALLLQVVLQHIPGQLMGELKGMDQAQLLQPGQRAFTSHRHRVRQALQRPGEIGEALQPANIVTHVNSSR